MTAIYKKVGRRYVEIGTFDAERDFYPHGTHLVVAHKGVTMTRFNVNPDHAGLLAASAVARSAMLDAMREADRMKLSPGTDALHRKAWEAYAAIAGEQSSLRLQGASMDAVVQAGIDALVEMAKGK